MTTGQRIREARKAAHMTQTELAQKLGIPFQSISQWERDIRNPKYDTIKRIAVALNVPVYELMDDYSPVVRELRNETITLEELAAETNIPQGKILAILNLEIEDQESLQKIKKAALNISMRDEKLLKLRQKVMPHTKDDLEEHSTILGDEEFIKVISPFLSPLDPLTDKEMALKIFLNSIGYDIMKTRGNYFFTHEHGGSEISTDDLNELLSCAQNGLKIAAKTLELKLMRKAFGPHYPAKIIIPPPSAPQADTDTTNEEPTPESLKSGE